MPTASRTDAERPATADPVEARAQAVVRPLNDVYRVVRGPLGSFEVADVSAETLSRAQTRVTAAREAVTTFSTAVEDPPAAYRSLPRLVTAHERLVDALTTAVDLRTDLVALTGASVSDPVARVVPLRSMASSLGTRADDLLAVVETDPAVPPSLFLTTERMRTFAETLAAQSRAVGRLLDVTQRELAAAVDWRAGRDAYDAGSFVAAGESFVDARDHYRDAASLLDGDLGTAGSFADVTDRRSCVAEAGLEAVSTALTAVDAARGGETARADRLVETAVTTRNRCSA